MGAETINYSHAMHILETLGFSGEQAQIQAYGLATYLKTYVVEPPVPSNSNLGELLKDKARLDWLGGPESVGRLEFLYAITRNAQEFRAAIDREMQIQTKRALAEAPDAK